MHKMVTRQSIKAKRKHANIPITCPEDINRLLIKRHRYIQWKFSANVYISSLTGAKLLRRDNNGQIRSHRGRLRPPNTRSVPYERPNNNRPPDTHSAYYLLLKIRLPH